MQVVEMMDCLEQCFSTFFDLRHPSLAFQQFDGTPNCILLVNTSKIQNLAAPLEHSAAPRVPRHPS